MVALAMEDVEHAPPLMTLEEWADMEEDEPGEFVDGRVVAEEVPSNPHELIVAWLMEVLRIWARAHQHLALGSEHKLGLSPRRGRKPDVCVYAPRTKLGAGSLSRKPPLLIVEVISTESRDVRRDRHEKRVEYARFGVRHYWLVDPASRLFEFLELNADGRYSTAYSAADGRVEVPGFEGLVLDLDQLWAEVELWSASDGEEEAEGDADVEPTDAP